MKATQPLETLSRVGRRVIPEVCKLSWVLRGMNMKAISPECNSQNDIETHEDETLEPVGLAILDDIVHGQNLKKGASK